MLSGWERVWCVCVCVGVCVCVCVSVISDQFHQFKDICVIKKMSSCFIQAVHKTN